MKVYGAPVANAVVCEIVLETANARETPAPTPYKPWGNVSFVLVGLRALALIVCPRSAPGLIATKISTGDLRRRQKNQASAY